MKRLPVRVLLFCSALFAGAFPEAHAVTVAPTGPFGSISPRSSLTIVQGCPAIAWADGHTRTVRYSRSVDFGGSAWGAPVDVDTGNSPATHVCLRVVNGKPAVCFFDSVLRQVRYVRALDAAGSAWETPESIRDVVVARGLSMEVIDGHPAIAVSDATLTYLRAVDFSGTIWTKSNVVGPVSLAKGVSLKVVQGRPAMAFVDGNNVHYVRSLDTSGINWPEPSVLAPAKSCESCSMAIISDQPAISFSGLQENFEHVMYIRASDAEGTVWGAPVVLETLGGINTPTSLSVVDGNPAVVWNSTFLSGGALRFLRATDATGSGASWGTPLMVRSDPLKFPAMLTVNGNPAVCGFDAAHSAIHYLRATNADGTLWPGRTLESWRLQHFNISSNTGDAGDDADPDQDGLTNFIEFAFGLSPVDSKSNGLPEFIRTGDSFTASFTAPATAGGILYTAESSSTLLPGSWVPIPDTGAAEKHVFSVSGGAERIFLRFVVRAW